MLGLKGTGKTNCVSVEHRETGSRFFAEIRGKLVWVAEGGVKEGHSAGKRERGIHSPWKKGKVLPAKSRDEDPSTLEIGIKARDRGA